MQAGHKFSGCPTSAEPILESRAVYRWYLHQLKANKLNTEQTRVISLVTFGNLLEWFDIYAYAYLSPILAKVFYEQQSSEDNLIKIFLIFGIAFIVRPFGGILFGRIGDRFGRKTSFLWSVILITIPTFAMGCLPTYSQIGVYASYLLAALRILQAIPAAGEFPGAMCFLYEFSNRQPGQHNRRFMTSWSEVGNQLGAILAVAEAYFMKTYTSPEFMLAWGWRITFWSAGAVGILSIYLRKALHETPMFESVKKHHTIGPETTHHVFTKYKRQVILGTAFGMVCASTFYLAATYIPAYLWKELGLTYTQNIIVTLSILSLSTLLLPFIGKLGDIWNNKMMLVSSILIVIVLLYPLQYAMSTHNMLLLLFIGLVYVIFTSCITALIGYVLAHLFPVQIRYTAVGLTFNIADGIVGGLTPAIALALYHWSGNQAIFCWYIFGTALVSLIAILLINDKTSAYSR